MNGIEPVSYPEHESQLPWPPAWRMDADVLMPANSLLERLGQLGSSAGHYWVLQQGPASPGSLRQGLTSLDSDAGLASALNQLFAQPQPPSEIVAQRLPPMVLAGVLFTRHPVRPDLDHVVVEGRGRSSTEAMQRLILHADGKVAWHSDAAGGLQGIGADRFMDLKARLEQAYKEPRAAEWIWDGAQLWLIQALPVGTLRMPQEAWTRRAGLGLVNQVISPLWYTLYGRWLKTAFWRPLGQKARWDSLANVEPYRRLHSHLYLNAQFIKALQSWTGNTGLDWALPPAWRTESVDRGAATQGPLTLIARQLSARRWRMQFNRLLSRTRADGADETWLRLIHLDQLGESLAAIEARVAYQDLPAAGSSSMSVPMCQMDLDILRSLVNGEMPVRVGQSAPGADPVWPRFVEQPADFIALQSLLAAMPDVRRARLFSQAAPAQGRAEQRLAKWLSLQRQLRCQRNQLAGEVRHLLREMAGRLVEAGVIRHPDDVFFLYFDELWQAWQGQARAGLADMIGERKVRYLADGHAQPPDWLLDHIGYGASSLGNASGSELVKGYPLCPGTATGRVQCLSSGWQLNQVQPGDVLVLDQCDAGWLPWIMLASAVVFAHRHPLDPAVRLVQHLGIPAVWGVDDAHHGLADGLEAVVDGDAGTVTWRYPETDLAVN